MRIILLLCMLFLVRDLTGQQVDTADLQSFFGNFTGGFCVCDIRTGRYIKYNPEHCRKRFSPASTFKIPNSLIGLETGVISDTAFIIRYDSLLHPADSFGKATEPFKHWYEDLSLKRAFQYSCVWYYQELARNVGQQRMGALVAALDYGNKDISGSPDAFWLCGSLEISVDEQTEFLKKLYLRQLPGFSDENQKAVKELMHCETADHYVLYGKTGSGDCWDDKLIGWFAGFVETDTGPKIFAMNVIVNDSGDLQNNFRIALTKKLLRELKIIN